MQCAERSPLFPSQQLDSPRVVLGPRAWSALVRLHPAIDASARVIEASLTHLGALGIDRYELKVRRVESHGMLDDRIWFLERHELQALVTALGAGSQSQALVRLMRAESRRAP